MSEDKILVEQDELQFLHESAEAMFLNMDVQENLSLGL
jgi:hypothetical protein